MAGARPPKKTTPARLRRQVAHYLERYATTEAHLRRLFRRRIHRAATHHGDDPAEGEAMLDAEIERVVRLGLVDDVLYATDRARRLVRQGNGPRKVRAKLAAKGVPSGLVDQALDAVADELGDPARTAVVRYARRRRLGPYASGGPHDVDERRKQLAKLARAGFSYDVARRVVDSEGVEELEAWATGLGED